MAQMPTAYLLPTGHRSSSSAFAPGLLSRIEIYEHQVPAMSPLSDTSSSTETGSIVYTQYSNSDSSPSIHETTSKSDIWEIPDRPATLVDEGPSVSLRTYKGGLVDREWRVGLSMLRQHARFEEVAEADGRHLLRRKKREFEIKRFQEEFEYIVDYINEGEYPIFYTNSDGFNVPKYCKVRRCAAYYGVKGLVSWIDAEKYRQVVVKRYENNSATFKTPSRGEMPADHHPSPFGGDTYFIGWRTIWKTELLVEKRDENGVPIRERQ